MLRGNKAQCSHLKHSFDNCLNVVQVYQCLQQVQKSRGCSCSLDLHVRSLFNRIDRHLGSFLKKIQLLSPTIASVIFCLLEIRWFQLRFCNCKTRTSIFHSFMFLAAEVKIIHVQVYVWRGEHKRKLCRKGFSEGSATFRLIVSKTFKPTMAMVYYAIHQDISCKGL